MDRSDGLNEDELLAYSGGDATAQTAAKIDAIAAQSPELRAELQLMAGLRGALAASTGAPDTRAFGWKRLEAEIGRTHRAAPAPSRPGVWRLAAAILGAVVLTQAAFIALGPGEAPRYRTVSEAPVGPTLGIAFVPTATAGEIETLLQAADARIVDGPSAIGLYRLGFEDDAARAAAQTVLTGSPLVALLAEE